MKENVKKPQDIRQRTLQYALRAVKLYQYLESGKGGAGKILGNQFLRSSTSIGANIREAQAAESRKDFIHKYSIVQKEARESLYWLELMQASKIVHGNRLSPLIKETDELISIITAIIIKTKKSKK